MTTTAQREAAPSPDTVILGRLASRLVTRRGWERVIWLALLAGTALLYTFDLPVNGYANKFYAAAVQAGATNWEAFLYGSFDGGNSITVDKPPAALWVMELSVRLFGLNSWSLLLPQALIGVATVAVTYATVRRHFPAPAAVVAGLITAVTPVSTLMFRYDNPDALLVLLLTVATYATVRYIEAGRPAWLALTGAAVGAAFLTKQLQAVLVLPALVGVVLYASPRWWRLRVWDLLTGLGALLMTAGWWVAVVVLVPAASRPYVGGSQHNSFLELTFGYNGLGRLTGNEGLPAAKDPSEATGGSTGLLRLFSHQFGSQVGWLVPTALAALLVALVLLHGRGRTDPGTATVLMLGGVLVVTGLAVSYASGIVHSYYALTMVPVMGGLIGIGGWLLWARRHRWGARGVWAAVVAGTAVTAIVLSLQAPGFLPELRVLIAVSAALSVLLLLASRTRPRLAVGAAATGLVTALLAPAVWSVATVQTGHVGSSPSAGPALRTDSPSSFPPGSRPLLPVSPELGALLHDQATGYRWVAATIGAPNAAPLQLAAWAPVMPIGGYTARDPSPTLAQFQAAVRRHQIHYFIPVQGRLRYLTPSTEYISLWVEANFSARTIGGVQVFDLARHGGPSDVLPA